MVAASIVALAVQSVVLVAGAWQIGIGWDEVFHVSLDWVQPLYVSHDPGIFGIYGYSTQYLGHMLNVEFGEEQWLRQYSYTPLAYGIRHLSFAIVGMIGVAVTGLTAACITGHRWVGWVSAAMLAAQPLWIGHSMMNPKDIPVAVGYSMFTAGLVGMVMFRWSRFLPLRVFIAMLFISIGLFSAMGFRLAMAVPLAGTFLVFVVLQLLRKQSKENPLKRIALSLIGVVIGLALILAANSYLLNYLSVNLFRSIIFGSGAYPWSGTVLFNGSIVSGADLPRWYWGEVLLLSVPIGIGVLALIGIVASGRTLYRDIRSAGAKISRRGAAITLVAMQALTLPIILTITRPVDYDMQRHHLYVFPAVAVLAGMGVWCLYSVCERRRERGSAGFVWGGRLLVLGVCLSLLFPVIEGARLFPYNYVYLNPIASIGGISGRWETDYWGLSLREAQRHVPKGAIFTEMGPAYTFDTYRGEQGTGSPIVSIDADHSLIIMMRRADWQLPSGCVQGFAVVRPLRFEELVLSQVASCP